MNSKKKLTVIYFTLIATIFITSSKAQLQLSYDNSNKSYSITIPEIPYQLIQGRTPYTKALLETGTGAFFTFQTSGRLEQTFSTSWYYNTNAIVQPIVSLYSFYDTFPPPKHGISFNFNPTPSSKTNPVQNILTTGQFIKTTNCIGDTIIPNDTMTLAVTYKNSSSNSDGCSYNQSVIAVFYNSPDNTNLFAQVPTDNTTYNFNGTAVKPLRKHNGETVTALSSMPSAIQSILNSSGGGFSKALYMTAPYISGGAERNFFMSLVPNPVPANYQSQTGTVKAVLIDYNSSNPSNCYNGTSFSQIFEVSLTSRDPNSITIAPDLFPNLSSAVNKPIDYKIHFENEGPGRANRILIAASIPNGIQFPTSGEEIFICKIGDDEVAVVEGSQPLSVEKKNRSCTYRLDPINRKIYFSIINAQLSGTVGLKGKNNIGEISFSLKTNSNRNIPKTMSSQVSVIFDDNKAETSSALIRVN
jgi:hypothetical protein